MYFVLYFQKVFKILNVKVVPNDFFNLALKELSMRYQNYILFYMQDYHSYEQ